MTTLKKGNQHFYRKQTNYKRIMKHLYLVTGTFHGSHVLAHSEGEARKMFHTAYNGESIIYIEMKIS